MCNWCCCELVAMLLLDCYDYLTHLILLIEIVHVTMYLIMFKYLNMRCLIYLVLWNVNSYIDIACKFFLCKILMLLYDAPMCRSTITTLDDETIIVPTCVVVVLLRSILCQWREGLDVRSLEMRLFCHHRNRAWPV